jgi:integrase
MGYQRYTRSVGIYTREKIHGQWQYRRVKFGRGKKHGRVDGPFYLRYSTEGKRVWQPTKGETLQDAMEEAESLTHALNAADRGMTVSELDEVRNKYGTTILSACEEFLKLRQSKAPRTVQAYTLHLREFRESLDKRTRYLDDIDAGTLRKFMTFMTEKGHAAKTQHNRLLTVVTMLKKNGIKNPLPWDEFPTVEVEAAVPFTTAELDKLFAAMTDEERVRYKFFLGTGARESEVAHATWADLDLHKNVFHIRAKPDAGFTLKSHESRSVPMPASLATMLKERKKHAHHPRWVFVNEDGNPEGHFLRKFKAVAYRAGLNCGHCTTETTQMNGEQRREEFNKKFGDGLKQWDEDFGAKTKLTRTVTCADAPTCQHFYLHRLRKTAATRWHEAGGIRVRTIQEWLGHKSLEVTQKYLGVADLHSPHIRQQVDAAFSD